MPRDFDTQNSLDNKDELLQTQPKFPATVRLAGIMWISFGALILVLASARLAQTVAAADGNGIDWISFGGALIPVVIGIAFIVIGNQSRRGKARDTLGNATGSIVLGLWVFLGGATRIKESGPSIREQSAETDLASMINGGINLLAGIGLIAAGILAIAGRVRYKEWRRWQENDSDDESCGEA